MAKDALAKSGIPLEPKGMNDNSPLNPDPDFYQTRGVHSLYDQCLQRCNGKQLYLKFDSPVLAIHGALRERIWIETTTQLLMLDGLAPAEPIPPVMETITLVDTPSVHWALIP